MEHRGQEEETRSMRLGRRSRVVRTHIHPRLA
jgi:hypothetical protein